MRLSCLSFRHICSCDLFNKASGTALPLRPSPPQCSSRLPSPLRPLGERSSGTAFGSLPLPWRLQSPVRNALPRAFASHCSSILPASLPREIHRASLKSAFGTALPLQCSPQLPSPPRLSCLSFRHLCSCDLFNKADGAAFTAAALGRASLRDRFWVAAAPMALAKSRSERSPSGFRSALLVNPPRVPAS